MEAEAIVQEGSGEPVIELKGHWSIHTQHPLFIEIAQKWQAPIRQIRLTGKGLESWDSSLLNFIIQCQNFCERNEIPLHTEDLPGGIAQLQVLAKSGAGSLKEPENRINIAHTIRQWLKFLGETARCFWDLLRGHSVMRVNDCVEMMVSVGVESLPIVALINFLIGLIMAFIGAVQLNQLGANIYVANLVAIAMAREMAAMMTSVILSGRVGAAFAATIGSMKVSQELDALSVMGVSPVAFLILPRLIALTLMMIPLCIFANLFGILGGACVTVGFFGVSINEYWHQTQVAVSTTSFLLGLGKSVVFGFIVASWGCLHGYQCESNSNAVGHTVTKAVVYAITSLILADACFAVLCNLFNI